MKSHVYLLSSKTVGQKGREEGILSIIQILFFDLLSHPPAS